MERKFVIIPVLVICFLTMSACNAQTTKETKSDKPFAVVKTITETEDCWKEFKDSTANVSIKFCGEPQISILNDTFNGENIKRNSYLVLDSKVNGNARYFLVWFEWKLKNEDENSLRKFYDEYIKGRLKRDSSGSLKDSREIVLNGKIGREFTLAAEDSNLIIQRIFYENGKVIIAAFMPNELSANKNLQNESRNKFFNSLKIVE